MPLEMSPFDRSRMSSYSTSSVTVRPQRSVNCS